MNEYICVNGADEQIGAVMGAMRTSPLEMNSLDFYVISHQFQGSV